MYNRQLTRLSVSRDKGQRSRFQNKFYATLNLHSNQRMQDQTYHAHGTIKTHSGNSTSIVHAVQGKEADTVNEDQGAGYVFSSFIRANWRRRLKMQTSLATS